MLSHIRWTLFICTILVSISETCMAGDWVNVRARLIGDVSNLSAVTAVADNDVWAAGSYVESGVGSKTLIEHWNGAA